MTRKLRFGQRLKERITGELRVFGLRAPARARWEGAWSIEAEESDHARVLGVAAAAHALFDLDLARRTWSGRTSEALGRESIRADLDTVDADVFLRLLGFRERAEKAFRAADAVERARLEAVAAGINAYIDGGPWSVDPRWTDTGTRPRLFGAADIVLLEAGPRLAARAADRCADPRVTARLALLAQGPPPPPFPLAAPTLPRLFPCEDEALLIDERVLPGGDDHRIATDDGWVRLSVRRPDIAVRGEDPVRPWLRTGPRGPLVSDLWADRGASPPTGAAVALAWERAEGDVPPRPVCLPFQRVLRLVPLDEGA